MLNSSQVVRALTAATLSLLSFGVAATSWEAAVALPMRVEHDTNPNLDSQDSKAVTRTIVTPDYQLTGVSENDQFQFGFGMHVERSSDLSVLPDREDPKLKIGWQREHERGAFGLLAKYEESSSLITGLEETGTQANKDSTRKAHTLAGNWSTAITERNTLEADSAYSVVTFTDGDDSQTDYDDYSAGLTWRHSLSERLEPFARLAATRYEPKGQGVDENSSESSTSYNPAVGIKFEMSEKLQATLRGGGNKVSNSSSGLNWQGGVDLLYTGERSTIYLDAGRNTVISNESGFTEVKQLKTGFSYAISELTRSGVDASWQDNQGDQPNTMQVYSAWISNELSPFWTTRLFYTYKQREEDGLENANGNVVGLSLIYSHPDF